MKTLALLLLFPLIAWAKPVAIAENEGVTVTLTDEPCAVKAVTNLPFRATWTEKDKTYEGCWGLSPPIVVSYWSDATVAIMSAAMFKKAVEI